jgi:hypothetical protein
MVGLLLTVTLNLAFGLSDLVRGATWTLLVPVTVLATLCGWGLGLSRVNGRAAFGALMIVGPLGVFAHIAGLIHPLARSSSASPSSYNNCAAGSCIRAYPISHL